MEVYPLLKLISSSLFASRTRLMLFVALAFTTVYWIRSTGHESENRSALLFPVTAESETFSLPAGAEISPVYFPNNAIVGRSVLSCPAGECVVEHRVQEWTPISSLSVYVQNDFAELVFEPGNPWYRGQDAGRCSATFNCATFAVAEHVHLTSNEWLGTTPTFDGYPTPIAIILDSYFTPICEWSIAQAIDNNDNEFETDERLRDGDVLAFESISPKSDRTRRIFTHLGLVKRQDELNRLLSKFGQGPILLSDLKFPDRMFPGAQKITIYRFRGDRP